MNNPDPKVPEELAPKVFALASRLYAEEEQGYSLAELIEAGGEAQIPTQFVQQALQQLQAEQIKLTHRQNKLKVALISGGVAIAQTKAKNSSSASQTLPKLHKHGIAPGDAVRVLLGKGKHSDKITTTTSVTAKEIVTPLGTFKPSALVKYVDRTAEMRALGIVPGAIVKTSDRTKVKVICTFGDGRVLAAGGRYYRYSELTVLEAEESAILLP